MLLTIDQKDDISIKMWYQENACFNQYTVSTRLKRNQATKPAGATDLKDPSNTAYQHLCYIVARTCVIEGGEALTGRDLTITEFIHSAWTDKGFDKQEKM